MLVGFKDFSKSTSSANVTKIPIRCYIIVIDTTLQLSCICKISAIPKLQGTESVRTTVILIMKQLHSRMDRYVLVVSNGNSPLLLLAFIIRHL